MERERSWMYQRILDNTVNPVFWDGMMGFLDTVFSRPVNVEKDRDGTECVRCPCEDCQNGTFLSRYDIVIHLCRHGFIPNYFVWTRHGESTPTSSSPRTLNPMEQMVHDVAGPSFDWNATEEPNPEAARFFEVLRESERPLWNGFRDTKSSVMSIVSMLLSIKSECEVTKEAFDRFKHVIGTYIIPSGNSFPDNFHESKKLVKNLGMQYEKIDVCPNNCMLFYGTNIAKHTCDFCGKYRFKPREEGKKGARVPCKVLRYLPLTPRLQRCF